MEIYYGSAIMKILEGNLQGIICVWLKYPVSCNELHISFVLFLGKTNLGDVMYIFTF